MKWLFDYDGVVNRTINKIIDALILNLLWFLFSLPIITAGASTTALYYTANKVLRKEDGKLWDAFWHSLKSNLRQSTLIWLLEIIIGFILLLDFYYAYQLFHINELSQIMMIAILLIVVAVFTWLLYLLPYISRFKDSTKTAIRNSGYICLQNPHWSILNSVFFAASLIIIWYIPSAIVIVPTVFAVISNSIMDKVFLKYMSE